MPDPKPWERQPGETSRAFGYFVLYRDLGPARTIEATVKRARERHESERRTGTPPTVRTLEDLCRPPHPVPNGKGGTRQRGRDWVRRCRAWDAEQDRIRRMKMVSDAIEEDREEGVALKAAFHRALVAVNRLTGDELKGKDAIDTLLEVVRLRRLRRGQATEVVGEVFVDPLPSEEETDAVRRALAADPGILDRFEADLARAALAGVAPCARDAEQPGAVEALPVPGPDGNGHPEAGHEGNGGHPRPPGPPAAR